MNLQAIISRVKLAAMAIFFFLLVYGLLCYPMECTRAVAESMQFCLKLLIPTLFPFIVLSAYAVDSEIGAVIAKPLGFISKLFFNLPGVCTIPTLLGLVGGYPAGSAGISTLLRTGKISTHTAGRMLLFCVNPGYAFVIGFLGAQVLKSERAGWFIFASILSTSILIGVISGLIARLHPESQQDVQSATPPVSSGALIRATQTAAASILRLCACVLAFTAFIAILDASGLTALIAKQISGAFSLGYPDAKNLLTMLLEITTGVNRAAQAQTSTALIVFALAFGGCSVHFQVFSFFDRLPLAKWKYFLSRIIHAFSAMTVYFILSARFPDATSVFIHTAPQQNITAALTMPINGGLALLLMCAAFLLIIGKKEEKERL